MSEEGHVSKLVYQWFRLDVAFNRSGRGMLRHMGFAWGVPVCTLSLGSMLLHSVASFVQSMSSLRVLSSPSTRITLV